MRSRAFLYLGLSACVLTASAQTASHQQLETWRSEIRKTLYIPQPLPELAVRNYGTFSPAAGVIAESVTYGTEFGMRIPAVLYRPEHHVERMPAMLVVNGHGGDKYSWYSFYTGILYARAGVAVLTYDPIGEGERNDDHKSGTREHDRVVEVEGYPQHLSGLMITDAMQGVSYLRRRPDIDPARIAILGYSMGSFVSALTGAVDTRIHDVVLSGGGDLDGPGGYWDSSTKLMCQAIPWQSLKVLVDRPAAVYALNQERGPTYLINGSADTLVDIPHHLEPYFADLRKRVEAITGTSKNILETYFVPNVSHRPNWVTRPAALWLKDNLGLPNWTKPQIEQMPETHISEWARQNDVTMDKGYIQEDREGGVMALGTSVPNLTREQLTVVPMKQWQENQDEYVYSAWVRHTLAELQPSKAK
jgi:dienelactone hydrolase